MSAANPPVRVRRRQPRRREIGRVLPVIEALSRRTCPSRSPSIPASPKSCEAAVGAGASLINDVAALRAPGALAAAARSGAAVCLMHMQGEPGSMQVDPRYGDVVAEVRQFLAERVAACNAAGIASRSPGPGSRHRLRQAPGTQPGCCWPAFATSRSGPVRCLSGLSRKSMLGALLGRDGTDSGWPAGWRWRLAAVLAGARVIVRTHDVAPTVDAVKPWRCGRPATQASGRKNKSEE
jgi:dihydropteroate synthase